MSLSEYFPKYFEEDNRVYNNEHKKNHFCGRLLYRFIPKENEKDFVNLKLFLISSFELNLIGQILFTHFKKYSEIFERETTYTSTQCYVRENPIVIIRYVAENEEGYFSREDFLEADAFFLEYLLGILRKNGVSEEELEHFKKELVKKMKEDRDIQHALNILNRLVH